MAFNPNEPRDFHGRWVHGVGAVKNLVDDLLKDGKITTAQARVAVKVAQRKADDDAADALKGGHPMHEHVGKLATSMRMKAAEANKNKLPKVAQQRRKEARAIEAVHAAITGKKQPTKVPTSSPSAPKEPAAKKAPTASAPESVTTPVKKASRQVNLTDRMKASINMAAVATAMQGSKYTGGSGKVRKWVNWPTAAKEFEERYARKPNEADKADVLKALGVYLEKRPYATPQVHGVGAEVDVPGGIKFRQNQISELIDKRSASILDEKRKMSEVKRAASGPSRTVAKGEGIKVVAKTKLQRVKIIGSKLQPGDIIDFGRSEPKIRVTGVIGEPPHRQLKWERLTKGNSTKTVSLYGSEHELHQAATSMEGGTNPIRTDKIFSVQRPVEVKQVRGTAKLTGQVNAQDFYKVLQDTLSSGHDLSELDPANRPLGKGQSVGHVQNLLYDMAVGKANRGNKPEPKVVAQSVYIDRALKEVGMDRKSISDATGYRLFLPAVGSSSFGKPGWEKVDVPGATVVDQYYLDLPGNMSPRDLKRYFIAVQEYAAARNWVDQGNPKDFQKFVDATVPDSMMKGLEETQLPVSQLHLATRWRYFLEEHRNAIDEKVRKTAGKKAEEMRKEEGTVPYAVRLPSLDKTEMKPQTFEDINKQMQAAPGQYIPSFYNASMLEDGVLYHRASRKSNSEEAMVAQAVDDVTPQLQKYHGAVVPGSWQAISYFLTYSKRFKSLDEMAEASKKLPDFVQQDVQSSIASVRMSKGGFVASGIGTPGGDKALVEALTKAGAYKTVNNKNIDPGYKGRGQIFAGTMHLLVEGGSPDPAGLAKAKDVAVKALRSLRGQAFRRPNETPAMANTVARKSDFIEGIKNAQTEAQVHKIIDNVDKLYKESAAEAQMSKKAKRALKTWGEEIHVQVKGLANAKLGGKRIEYVPHSQDAQGAPRSQRGRLTLEGYSPEEAHAKLQELGVVGDLEPEVPFGQVMGGPRRSGVVTPLHPAYVRGEAPPPSTPALITHGLTGGASVQSLKSILDSGGLLSISERFRRGIHVRSSSPAGDIRSGIDHVVFSCLDSGGSCGSGSSVRIGLRPEALMRRDVILAPRDFGGMGSRYNHYKSYRDELEARAGEQVGRTTLYDPLSPDARQLHLNDKAARPGSSEFNVRGQVPVEDMAVIAVPPDKIREVQGWLTELLANGKVKEIPKVIPQNEFGRQVGSEGYVSTMNELNLAAGDIAAAITDPGA